MKYISEGGTNVQLRECGCPQGTTIVMKDLFFNVPVRRAFLKKPSYEGGLVSDAVSRMLLGNPGVSMRFISGGSQLFHWRVITRIERFQIVESHGFDSYPHDFLL